MEKIKHYFKYVNLWNWILVVLTVWVGYSGSVHGVWNSINCVILVVGLFLLGRASLDRELEINLDKAKEAIANASQN